MGFVKGKEVTVIKSAPLSDPNEYKIMGYNISLRRSESRLIEVMTMDEALSKVEEIQELEGYDGTIIDAELKTSAREKGKIIDITLVGNPNSGKTTLFNFVSGTREHVGNFSGVTVDSKTAKFR